MRMRIGGRRAVAGVLLLAGLAGCSASGGLPAATATSGRQDAAAVWHEVVQCARQHGYPSLQDPQVDSEGRPHWPDGPPSGDVPQACLPIFERLPPSARGEQPAAGDVPALLRFARCMREHGLDDFPDPDADGTFTFAGTTAGRELKGPSPRARTALDACGGEQYLKDRVRG